MPPGGAADAVPSMITTDVPLKVLPLFGDKHFKQITLSFSGSSSSFAVVLLGGAAFLKGL